jgi:hypothetical protein
MDEERSPVVFNAQEPPDAGPTISRIGRRSDSRMLTFASAAAVVFLAVAIAKPWDIGTQPPVPSGSTSSLAVAAPEPATASDALSGSAAATPWPATAPTSEALETPQSAFFYIETDGVPVLIETDGVPVLAMGCGDHVYTFVLSTAVASADPATGQRRIDAIPACASGTPQEIYLVLPSPGAP